VRRASLIAGLVLTCSLCPMCLAGEFRAPLMRQTPVLDGVIRPDEWVTAVCVDGFAWQGQLERRRAYGLVGTRGTYLYVAIVSQLPDQGEIIADVDRDSENLVFDDSVEVWVDPTFGAERGRRYQMLANSLGHRYFIVHPYGGEPDNPAWRGDWQVANGFADGFWTCEVRIPLESIAPGKRADELVFGINLCRNWKQEWAFSSMGGGAYEPSDKFTFGDDAPLVWLHQMGDQFQGDISYTLFIENPGDQPLSLVPSLRLERDVMPELMAGQLVAIPAGGGVQVPLETSDKSTRKFRLTAAVTSGDGGTTFYSRTVEWPASGPFVWVTKKQEIQPVDFQFAYYPYLNKMRILADVSNLPAGAVLRDLTATVRHKGGDAVARATFARLVNGKQELTLDLPPLEGDCEVALKATGDGVPDSEVARPLRRIVYEWEHNQLGKSTKVYPPFMPIKVDGSRVSTVLRDHAMGGSGLWDQVTARGKDLLAAPMRWEARIGGAEAPVSAGELSFSETAGDHALAQGSLEAGDLRATVRDTWDYDGMMRVDLDLQPTGGRTVEDLTLVIPLRADQATHYHAMGDGIRNTLYARVPEGDGVVWTADQVKASDLPERFCTYIYVGTPVRGLCWFAENDRNWGWDPKTPNVDLVRQGDQVLLRVHLINRPTTIDEARTITFGLLAAPVKPRMSDDWRHKYRRDRYSLLGTDINWLALGDCGSVYPAGKDMYLWEMIARGNREHLAEADIQSVIDRGTPYFAPYGQDRVNAFVAHARYNLTARYGTKMIYYYNRASCQVADEFETFKDEWCLTDYRTVGEGTGIWEIKIVPSESYIDHAVYWYAKSFDIGGNQGVYWDNWFFAGSYNTVMTGAYRRPDGHVVPSTGIWGLRELAKRTFRLMNERGMLPVTMPHMTSTAILPLLSFATLQYDWEWKYSEGDVQYRFPREYILMVTNGELAGVWPVLLNDHGPQAEDPWTARTFAAVAMLHELDCPYPEWSEVGRQQLALFRPVDEILARPGVLAYRYWDDEPQPVVTDNPDLPTIVYSVPGEEAVFAVVSYADADTTATVRVDTAALGFPGECKVSDTETGEELPLRGGALPVSLKKHNALVCRVTPM